MACSIKIDSVEPDFDIGAATINGLVITYTVVECKRLKIEAFCGTDSLTNSTTVDVVADGTYTETLKISCPCGSRASVVITCVDDPGCSDKLTFEVECENCPEVEISATFVSQSEDDVNPQECNFDGSVTVTLDAIITPPLGVQTLVSQWDFGDGNFGQLQTNFNHTTTHDYETPGTYTATLIIAGYENCPVTSIEIGPLLVCPCPSIDLTDPEITGCAGNGQSANVTFSGTVDPLATECEYKWNFGDGSSEDPTDLPENSHAYTQSGDMTGAVTMICGDCISTTPFNITIPACPGGGGGVDDPVDDPVDNGEGGLCQFARWTMVIAAIIGIVAAALISCIPAAVTVLGWTAAIAGFIAVIAGFLWSIFCKKPCGWGYLFAWQVALGAGLLLIHFITCCPTLTAVGGGLIVTGLAIMWIWVRRCKVSQCRLFAEILVIFTAVVTPTMAWLALVPLLSACINPFITAIVALLAALLVIKVARCARLG